MKKLISSIAVMVLIAVIALSFKANSGKLGPKLTAVLDNTNNQSFVVYVYFRDKGPNALSKLNNPLDIVSQRSLERRMKVRSADNLLDYNDIPLYNEYVNQVSQKVSAVRHQLSWFNAMSVEVNRQQLENLSNDAFISQIELVESFRRPKEDIEQFNTDVPVNNYHYNPLVDTFNYGLGGTQMTQIKVNLVHNQGVFGQGVLIASFDVGWKNQTHEVFTTLPMQVIGQFDFQLHRQGSNWIGNGSTHGTQTLSNIGAYFPTKLIGPSFKSRFIVARTEVDSFERPIEMDNWSAAAIWADSAGADVISSSLGYLAFDAGYPSWTWQDMNGRTLVSTNAADLAADRGIVVCNSAGNSGYVSPTQNTLGSPADGDSVITVGAVTSTGTRASFSSCGPTTDVPNRIKPDVMAMGSGNYVATVGSNTAYTNSSGTSFSCPLTAGVCGLVLSANKDLTPIQVRNLLRRFASNNASPNNTLGWGIIDASLAVDSARKLDNTPPIILHTQPFTNTTNNGVITMKAKITDNGIIRNWTNQAPLLYYRSSTNNGVTWSATTPSNYTSTNLDTFFFPIPGFANGTTVQYYFAAQDIALPTPLVSTLPTGGSGNTPPGTTPPSTRFQYTIGVSGIINNGEIPKEFKLYSNYPNPFNPTTKIKFDIARTSNVKLVVFDVLGREVQTLLNEKLNAGGYEMDFNAVNLPSGVYFYKITTETFIDTKKMLLVK